MLTNSLMLTHQANSRRSSRCRSLIGASLLALTVLVSPAAVTMAMAQDTPAPAAPPKPPAPGREDDTRPLLTSYFLLILVLACVLGANALPSKRTHQD